MANKLRRIPLRDRIRELERIYGVIEREIAKEMALMDIGNYQELRAIKTQERIDELIKMLNRAAIKWSKEAVPEAYERGYAVAKTRLEILGIMKDYNFPEKTHKQTVENETDITMDVLIKANQSIKVNVATFLYLARTAARGLSQFQAFDMRDEEFIDELLGEALRAGETRGYASKAVREYFRERFGDAQFIRINGRNYEMRAYADLVAKTRLRTVQSEAVKNSCQEYENDLIQISAHGTDCLICQEYEGNVYSISGRHPVYSLLPAWPPYHPRCQHNALPTSEVALEWRKRLEEPDVGYVEPIRVTEPAKIDFHKNLTEKEKKLIKEWSETEYKNIRSWIGMTPEQRQGLLNFYHYDQHHQAWLTKQMKDAEMFENLFRKYKDGMSAKTLYRSLYNIKDDLYKSLKEYKFGEIIKIDRSISSWSYDKKILDKFTHEGRNNIHFILKKGRTIVKELDIEKYSKFAFEKEVLVYEKEMKIIKIEEIVTSVPGRPGLKTNTLKIYMEEIGG